MGCRERRASASRSSTFGLIAAASASPLTSAAVDGRDDVDLHLARCRTDPRVRARHGACAGDAAARGHGELLVVARGDDAVERVDRLRSADHRVLEGLAVAPAGRRDGVRDADAGHGVLQRRQRAGGHVAVRAAAVPVPHHDATSMARDLGERHGLGCQPAGSSAIWAAGANMMTPSARSTV